MYKSKALKIPSHRMSSVQHTSDNETPMEITARKFNWADPPILHMQAQSNKMSMPLVRFNIRDV
jgi:hypothetical protein